MLHSKSLKFLITGKTGQVGQAFCAMMGDEAIGVDHQALDFTQPETIAQKLAQYKPDVIINPAAYTAVDACETHEEQATLINVKAVEELARYAFEQDIPLIHYSTDYVFNGEGVTPWREDDATGPINAYGRTKLAGEKAIQALAKQYSSPKWLIFRTSWVYNEDGKNFVNTMLRLGQEKECISVIDDQIGAPTYAGDIAYYTLEAVQKALEAKIFPSGIYHMTNSGETSWHGFAEAIFRHAEAEGVSLQVRDVKEIATKDYPTPAARPHNSRLCLDKLEQQFGLVMPSWQHALQRSLKQKFRFRRAAA